MSKDIKIFVSCHKPSIVLKNNLIYPVQVGTALSKKPLPNMLHDNEGDNISSKNRMYCELTAQYYVWKNIQADYYGFFHYRRYLSFSNKQYKENFEGIICNKLNEKAIKDYALDETSMRNLIEQYDVIAPKQAFALDVYKQYCLPKTQNKKDIDFCLNYIYEHFPEMKKIAKKAIHSSKSYFCNMFIMKKEIFQKYCAWLFEILEAHEKAMPLEHYDVQAYRVSGYLAERLCAIYLKWLKSQSNIKFKEVQRVMFKQTDDSDEIKADDNVCPILINADDKNFLNCGVLVNSIVKNTDEKNQYLIILNDLGLKFYQTNYFKRLSLPKNIKLKIISEKSIKNIENYNKIANYFKFLNKLVYISSNCIVNSDIYELFGTELKGSILGTRDLYKIIEFGKIKLKKQADLLERLTPYDSISSELLMLDLHKLRAGQCECQLLAQVWNVGINEKLKLAEKVYAFAPHYINNEYASALKNPKVVSFKGKVVPLNYPLVEFGDLYWQNALDSGLYELCNIYLINHYHRIRKNFYDTICPQGSYLRLFTKTYIKKY